MQEGNLLELQALEADLEASIEAKAVLDAAAAMEANEVEAPAEQEVDIAETVDAAAQDAPSHTSDDAVAEAGQVAEPVTPVEDAGVNASEVMTENATEADQDEVVPPQEAPVASNETHTNDHASESDDEATPGRHNQHLNNEPT